MRIEKIYNNNAILVVSNSGSEKILVGRGLAYGKRRGDDIDQKLAEKKFELKKEVNNKFEELIQSIPLDYILLCENIIAYIKKKSKKEIDDSIYVTLTDHIVTMLERIQKGIDFDSFLLLNVKSLYPEEYRIALGVVDLINSFLNINIGKEEANFISLHIVNAETDYNMLQTYTIIEIVNGITDIVDEYFTIDNDQNVAYDRFITHCRFFVQKIVNTNYVKKDTKSDSAMLKIVKHEYPEQNDCVERIVTFLKQKYGYITNDEEKFYLLIHVVKLTT